MLETEIRTGLEKNKANLFGGMAEPGTNLFEEAERESLKLKFVEFSVTDLLYSAPDWPGRDRLLEAVMNTDMSGEETLIFVGTGKEGEKHSDIVARALGIEPEKFIYYRRCQNAGSMKFREGKWIVGGVSYNLMDRLGREVYSILYSEKSQMDSKTGSKLTEIYGTERQFESGLVE